jgi:hypothetical protein
MINSCIDCYMRVELATNSTCRDCAIGVDDNFKTDPIPWQELWEGEARSGIWEGRIWEEGVGYDQ